MPISWFTVVAQAINFLLLVWLLKRFLYKPILDAIDKRERGISTKLAETEAKKADAQKERDDFQHKSEAFDQERAALLQRAKEEAKTERQRLLDETVKEADSLRAKRQEALRNEKQNLNQSISRWAQREVFAIARKTLKDLASTSLEERMGEAFVFRLRELNGTTKEQLSAALEASVQPARVCSAFDLPPAQRKLIEAAIKEIGAPETRVQFETAPELISGIELSTNGQKVAWSIADYLATLEKSAGELLHEDAKPEQKTAAKQEPKAGTKPWPKAEAKNGPEPVASAPKVSH
jgi:F-type H+-transporting ATPase subunit b